MKVIITDTLNPEFHVEIDAENIIEIKQRPWFDFDEAQKYGYRKMTKCFDSVIRSAGFLEVIVRAPGSNSDSVENTYYFHAKQYLMYFVK